MRKGNDNNSIVKTENRLVRYVSVTLWGVWLCGVWIQERVVCSKKSFFLHDTLKILLKNMCLKWENVYFCRLFISFPACFPVLVSYSGKGKYGRFFSVVIHMNERSAFMSNVPPAVKNLLVINFIFWLADLALPRLLGSAYQNFNLSDILGMHYWASEKFHVFQILTYMFMHGGFSHMFFNMFALYMFGIAIEQRWGTKRFLIFYLVSGIGAALVQQLMWTIDFAPLISALNDAVRQNSSAPLADVEEQLRKFLHFGSLSSINSVTALSMKQLIVDSPLTVGASGAIFGLLFAFAWLFPDARMMLIFLPIPISARVFVALYAIVELFFGVAGFSFDNIAHFAHLGGMLFGWLLILYWKRKGTLYG